ncbi:MAG: DNA topoisomerase I [Nanoarchaeota archaeon]|nr:DNA topoisomerase I [Nanoarchaeota archaeon]
MLRKRKIKPREQKTAEEFFPVDVDDLKHTVEKIVKQAPAQNIIATVTKTIKPLGEQSEQIIKTLTKRKPRKSSKKVTEKTSAKTRTLTKGKTFSLPKISLKENGYELVITEKPQAAMKIASALGKASAKNIKGVPYYEVNRNGKNIVVACAVGHLFTLKQSSAKGQKLPVFDISWVPNYMAQKPGKTDFTKKYYDVLSSLAKNAGSVTVATDYDIEGEVIGFNVVRFITGQKDANRMKFSTLTEKELNDAYESKENSLNWGQAIAGETRHYLDWFYGINLSRALMNAIKSTGKFKIMSIGRVQGPSLNLIVKKEKDILAFKSQPYWQIFITLEHPEIELIHNKDIFKKEELGKFHNLSGKIADVNTEKKQQEIPPNPPFNLTNLQTEAYRLFGINPAKTLQLAQSLYLAGLISYPRTSSQKLPISINYREILRNLSIEYKAEKFLTRAAPVEGKKTDPAHPSIYPTGNKGEMGEDERKVYDLIVRRFLSLFCEDAVLENKVITAKVNGFNFVKRGSSVKNPGWMKIYPIKMPEAHLPDVTGKVRISDSRMEEKETQPPRRFSPASLVSELEKRNLGTKATRAAVLETLYDRGYVQGQSIKATPLGISLIETLEKHSPIIIDEALTRKFEKEMDEIQKMKRGLLEKEEKVIGEAKSTITKISGQFKQKEAEIGEELAGANTKLWAQQREENKLNICPLCKKGSLQIIYSKKTRRNFIGCSNYPECKNTYSLPPNSLIKKSDKICEQCGFPMLLSIRKGKRPWVFCFNKECETNKKRIEEYRKKQEVGGIDKG